MKDLTEAKIRKAIRLAIKAKQIEKTPVIYTEESFGINFDDEDIEARASSPFYDRLKTKLDKKMTEVENAKAKAEKRYWKHKE